MKRTVNSEPLCNMENRIIKLKRWGKKNKKTTIMKSLPSSMEKNSAFLFDGESHYMNEIKVDRILFEKTKHYFKETKL